ncbi:MAG: cyclase family protein [Spirochaetaceae bacterium]|jgi:kynurenine formamidase|nr:cyclase family protein [Spirochaetaceae bacterium]
MKYHDMSVALYHNCPAWPERALPEFSRCAVHGVDGVMCERVVMDTHTGTHLDAPLHFFPDGISIDKMPLEAFCGRAHLVDLLGIAPRAPIGPDELRSGTRDVGQGDIVLLRTGWTRRRGYSPEYYHDWPYLSKDGALFLLKKKIKGAGIDAMSMGGWYENTGRPCHEVLLGAGVWLVEELFFPEELMRHKTCQFTAVPLKLQDFGGSPTRAFAVTAD